jgi:hypothetical protein
MISLQDLSFSPLRFGYQERDRKLRHEVCHGERRFTIL